LFGQRLDVAAGDRAEQQQFQHFVVGQGRKAARNRTIA